MAKTYVVGISRVTYNNSLRILETTLVDGSRGPDISLDAIIANKATIDMITKLMNAAKDSMRIHQQEETEMNELKKYLTKYDTDISSMVRLVDDIESIVNSANNPPASSTSSRGTQSGGSSSSSSSSSSTRSTSTASVATEIPKGAGTTMPVTPPKPSAM